MIAARTSINLVSLHYLSTQNQPTQARLRKEPFTMQLKAVLTLALVSVALAVPNQIV